MADDQHTKDLIGKSTRPAGRQGKILRTLIPVIILCAGIGTASYMKNSAPKTRKRPPARLIPTVQVAAVQPSTHQVVVSAMGTVVPAREMVLEPRVSGEIVALHPDFAEGSIIQKGSKILQIDPEDYRLILTQKQREVANAEYALKLELGHQTVAKREWELLKGDTPAEELEKELALREPHLDKARADLAAAQADLKQTTLDLERTHIFAPFNALVLSKSVDLGSQVTPQKPLAQLVGTDTYWVQVSVPIDRLKWIKIPRQSNGTGSDARITYAQGKACNGTVIRLMGDLAAEGRMARILVEVKDPLGLNTANENRTSLLIGEYVRVDIQGRKLENIFQIPRAAFRDDSTVWIAGKTQTLEIRKVHPIWRDAEVVLLQDGLKPGERLIVSDLAAPMEGMTVRVDESESEMVNEPPTQKKAEKDKNI
ncbi:efflux RND transporter periplasmic adaptor subunit [Thermodesulfobacteriota bacterium]